MDKGRRHREEVPDDSITYMVWVLIFVAIVFVLLILFNKGESRIKTVDPRLWLGVETIELTPAVKQQYDLLDSNGILVSRTFLGSPASIAGIKEGDVIQRWNGISILNQDQFQFLIQTADPGVPIVFTVDRQGQQARVSGRVGIRPGGM